MVERSEDWPEDWWEITDPEHQRMFARELQSELSKGHILYGVKLTPLARANGRDDYLFAAEDGRVAEVHLTFANRPERPPWPGAAWFANLAEWRKEKDDEQNA